MRCLGLPWERNADFPQMLFYLLDIVIHLMLGGSGVQGVTLGAWLHLNHSGKLGRLGREWPGRGWRRGGAGLGSIPPARPPALGLYAGQGPPVGEGGPRPGP